MKLIENNLFVASDWFDINFFGEFASSAKAIKEKLNLTEGINYHKGEIVIVKPKDVNKAKALSRALKNLNISGINF